MIIQFNSAAGDQESTDRTATTLWSKRHAVADRPAAGVHGPTRLPARLASDSRRGLCTATTREAVGRVDMNVGFLNEEMLVSSTFNCQLNHAPCRLTNLQDEPEILETPVLLSKTASFCRAKRVLRCKTQGSPRFFFLETLFCRIPRWVFAKNSLQDSQKSCRPLFCRIPRWALYFVL